MCLLNIVTGHSGPLGPYLLPYLSVYFLGLFASEPYLGPIEERWKQPLGTNPLASCFWQPDKRQQSRPRTLVVVPYKWQGSVYGKCLPVSELPQQTSSLNYPRFEIIGAPSMPKDDSSHIPNDVLLRRRLRLLGQQSRTPLSGQEGGEEFLGKERRRDERLL